MQNVLIVDDHPVMRMAVRLLLEKDGMTIVAESGDGFDAITKTKELSPDLVIIDIDIPSLNGIEVIQRLRSNGYHGAVLVLSGKDDDHYVKRCASNGADGFVSKGTQLAELHDAIRALSNGYGYFPRTVARLGAAPNSAKSDKEKVAGLSSKELRVMHHLAKGEKIIDIGVLMNISDKTVSTYKRRLMQKLELSNMMELYDFVNRNQLD